MKIYLAGSYCKETSNYLHKWAFGILFSFHALTDIHSAYGMEDRFNELLEKL